MPLHANVPAEQSLGDYDVLADYVGGRLSDLEAKRFEKRLAADPQLLRRMAPFLSVLYPVEPPPIELEVRARVAARRAARRRQNEERLKLRRRIEDWMAIMAGALSGKAIAGFATATAAVAFAAVELARTPEWTPLPVYVQWTPITQPPVTTVLAAVQKAPVRSRHRASVAPPAVVTQVAELPAFAPVDSAAEQLAARIDSQPLPGLGEMKSSVETGRVARSVAAMSWVTVTVIPEPSRVQQVKDALKAIGKGAVGAVAAPVGVIKGWIHKARTKRPKITPILHSLGEP